MPGHGAHLTGGLLHAWRRRNAAASMPLALHQLVVAGNLDNLQLAISAAGKPVTPGARASGVTPAADLGYHGPVFMDSDIYKTLEAVGWELGSAPSAALADFAVTTIELLGRVQRPDGYLDSYIQASGEPPYQNLSSSHEMYCAGHFIQAAIALRRGAGNQQALDIAVKLADHLVKEFAGQGNGLDGHPIIETALVELYRETGTAGYRDLASQFVEQRGRGLVGDSGFGRRYLQDHLPVRERTTEVGHAVRALYLEAGVTDVATETNDRELLDGSVRRWRDMVAAKTHLTGGNGSRHNDEAFGDRFELPPDRAYNETCAAIASFQWSWRLLLATGDATYADHMERILYNGFAAAISTEGNRFFYVNPLQRRVDHYERDDPGRRREWFKTACCPPNIMRLFASLQHYLATTADGTLYLHQYATASVTGARLTIEIETDYPWDGRVTIRVTSAPDEEREIAMRVPAWSAAAGITVKDPDESSERVPVPPDRYLRLRRAWRPGDELRLRLDLTPRWTYPDPRVDAVRGCAAVERGPLVYCFEQADQAARLGELAVIPAAPLTERTVTLPGIGRTIQVTAPARHIPPGPAAAVGQQVVTAVAIPYFQWDNRGPGAMRAWIPVADPADPM
ncbi:MAG: glycoside hydrolase family 127 protein [Trebonia sp.]